MKNPTLIRTIVTNALAGLGLCLLSSASLATSSLGPLVSPASLSSQLSELDPIILDLRGDAFAKGHIAGAVSAPYGLFRGPAGNPGEVPAIDKLEQTYESLGLTLDRPVVIVPEGKTDTDFGAAARVYWTLKSTGFNDLSILNGGTLAWQAAGLPMDTNVVTPEPSELTISFSDQWTAGTEQVAAITRGDVDALLLDARPVDFYEGRKGHDAAARPGTMPGAENHVYTSFFDQGSPAMSAIPDASPLLKTLGVQDGEEIVSFCNTGHWAATNWFALSEVAGLDNVKLYPGSMVEYSNAGLEMANSPGLVRNFLNKLQGN